MAFVFVNIIKFDDANVRNMRLKYKFKIGKYVILACMHI